MRKGFRFASFLLALCMLCALLGGCMGANVTAPQPAEATPQATSEPSAAPEQTLDEDGSCTSKDDVALYIHLALIHIYMPDFLQTLLISLSSRFEYSVPFSVGNDRYTIFGSVRYSGAPPP